MDSEVKFNSSNIPVYVTSVSINGLRKTNSDFIKKQLSGMVKSKTFAELLRSSSDLRHLLLGLQIFNSCEVMIDTEKTAELPNAYKVDVYVDEKKPQTIKAQWTVNTDGAMRLGGFYSMNNIFGKGERLQLDANIGRDSSGMRTATFVKPLESNPAVTFSFGGSDSCYDHWWSRFLRKDKSIFAEINAPSRLGMHKLQWSNLWREIQPSSSSVPWTVRQESGPSVRLNLRHQFEFDSRSDRIFPDDGALLRLTQDLSFITPGTPGGFGQVGLGAATSEAATLNTGVCQTGSSDRSVQLRMDSLFQLPIRLTSWLVGELTFSSGFVHSLTAHSVSIADMFFMGGPLDLRGFRYCGLGPSKPLMKPQPLYTDVAGSSEEPTCPVGALGSWLAGAHLYSPLPLSGGYSEDSIASSIFRLHAFAMAGNLIDDPIRAVTAAHSSGHYDRLFTQLKGSPRYVLGAGLILRFANAVRLELNYCFPMNPHPEDSVQSGFQIGVGLTYM